MTQLSTQPYRGTKDYFPEDQRLIRWLKNRWHEMAQAFGYEEYTGPLLEPIELYLSKTSEEIVNDQLYHVHDKGERHLAIRPEITPTLARMVASRVRQLPKPIRWYSIPSCMRFERPQRSRLRQFDQFNLDILGGDAFNEDTEVLLTIVHMLRTLGAQPKDFQIKINHRGITNAYLEQLKVPGDKHSSVLRLMDAINKMPEDEFAKQLGEQGLGAEQITALRDFMQADLAQMQQLLPENPDVAAMQRLLDVSRGASGEFGVSIVFSPEVMRGFDYYTSLVFEVFDTHPDNRRALFGGGRYDNLVGSFGGDALSGVGYAVSEISLINFMATHDLTPKLQRPVTAIGFVMDEDDASQVQLSALAMKLRQQGVMVEQLMGKKKPGKALASAAKLGAAVAFFLGSQEVEAGEVSVKWMGSGEQLRLPADQCVDRIVQQLRDPKN